jgi:Zn-dependent protease with chaperone function
MTPLFSYFLQGSLVTASFLLFYKLLLRRDTFFKWSRWYFITAALASFLLSLVDVSALFADAASENQVIAYLPDLSFSAVTLSSNPWENFVSNLLYAGIVVMAVRLLMQMIALLRLRKNKHISKQHPVKIIELNERINPFSFFNEIYVNPNLHSEAELEEIIRHEQFHIQQKHTLDILLGEVLTIVFWFNPFAWLLKNELKQNLEFLTDKLVLETGIDAKHYQYNLLKVSGLQNNIAAANHFHFLKLKNRIIMMNKQQTHPYHAVKFLLLVPIVALLLMAFAERKQLIAALQEPIQQDTTPPPPPKPPVVKNEIVIKESVSPSGEKQLPADIKEMRVIKTKDEQKITVTLKNGKREVFDLNKPEDKKRFEQKYGKLQDPPSPPGLPTSPADVQSPVAPADVVVTLTPPGSPDIATAPTAYTIHQRKEVPMNEKGYYLSIADDNGECVVIVKDKTKKILEAILLTDWNKKESFYENKYGKIPPVHEHTTTTVTTPDGSSHSKTVSINNIYPANVTVSGTANTNNSTNTTVTAANVNKTNVVTTVNTNNVVAVTTADKNPPLYIVDGKIVSKEEADKIDPGKIESINVLKGEKAIDEYGEKGKNGVIKINLKK